MSTEKTISGFMFGATVLICLMPLTFTFSQNGAQLLLETSSGYFVWGGQIIILLVLLLAGNQFSKKQSIALALLYGLVPFVFLFDENGIYFLILNQYTSSVLSWAIASVLLGKLLLKWNLKQDSLT